MLEQDYTGHNVSKKNCFRKSEHERRDLYNVLTADHSICKLKKATKFALFVKYSRFFFPFTPA